MQTYFTSSRIHTIKHCESRKVFYAYFVLTERFRIKIDLDAHWKLPTLDLINTIIVVFFTYDI